MSDQLKIPCICMRGGTSRCTYFITIDLPEHIRTRDKVLITDIGYTDSRQII